MRFNARGATRGIRVGKLFIAFGVQRQREVISRSDSARLAKDIIFYEVNLTMTWIDFLLAGLAAVAAGLVNALAGGGTLITFPTLTALGVSSGRCQRDEYGGALSRLHRRHLGTME